MIEFDHYELKDGMSGKNIYCMLKDSRGFMWFGTSDGLNRFDGYNFKVYEASPFDSSSLSFNAIFSLAEDDLGRIWVGTGGGGINMYDWRTEKFEVIKNIPDDSNSLNNDYIQDLLVDKKGRVWVATNDGLAIQKSSNSTAEWLRLDADPKTSNSILQNEITAIAEDYNGRIWIGYSKMGVSAYEPNTEQFTHYQYQRGNKKSLTGNLVKDIVVDQDGDIWIGSHNGITKISVSENQEADITRFSSRQLPGNRAWALEVDGHGNVWAGLFGKGLAKLSDSALIAFYEHDPQNLQSLNGNKISSLYFSNDGQLWIGAETKGLNRADLRKNETLESAILHYKRQPEESAVQSITALTADKGGNLWIGSEGDGLEKSNLLLSYLERWSTNGNRGANLSHVIVTTILQDKLIDSVFWIGTFGGFNKLTLKGGRSEITSFLHSPNDTSSLSDNHIFAAYEDDNGYIWLGTRGGGLNRFDKKSQSFKRYLHKSEDPTSIPNNYVWNIIPDTSENLWLATDGGLCLFDPQKEEFYTYKSELGNPQSLSSNYLNVLFQDSKGRLWIGTGGAGLNLMIRENENVYFKRISERDGLIDNFIYGILEDEKGYLWMSTNQGITRFNPEIPFSNPNYASQAFLQFTEADGLQDDEFNTNAFAKLADGRLVFGGVNGINIIFPTMIRPDSVIPQIEITEIRVLNEVVRAGVSLKSGNIPLRTWDEKSITLTHKDYVVSFRFSGLNYSVPEKSQYAYMLEGVDPDWVYSANNRQATYTNLAAGTYTFHVKASNQDGIWNEEGTSFNIVVKPAPWLTWWAKILYLLSAIALIYGFIRYRIYLRELEYETERKIALAKSEERENLRKRTAADFHDELGNKMTKIGLFVELARRSKNNSEELGKYLTQVESHTNSLSQGVRDFIWILDPDQDTLFDMLLRLKDFGNMLFEYTDVRFTSEGINEELSQHKLSLSTRRHLMLIFKEAMNNTLKYAKAKKVSLVFEDNPSNSSWIICLKDDGKGFDIAENSNGYGLNNMQMRAGQIGGKLTISSKKGEGTEVKIEFYKL